MRLSPRLIAIAALTVLVGGFAAGCSGSPGTAYAGGGNKQPDAVITASVPPGSGVQPQANMDAVPSIQVAGAPRGVGAKGGILADAATGQVLWKKNPDAERPMASITKVMTAYLVIQRATWTGRSRSPRRCSTTRRSTARAATD